MSGRLEPGTGLSLTAENIGGIDRTSVRLDPGVNVLEGRNATNRTSLLQAIMAGFGSDRSTLKGDADEGRVDLEAGDASVTRRLRRKNGAVVFEGETFLEDPELADLFAFLLASNPARAAGKRGEDLRELIMRPIDTAEIRARIRSLEAEKREIDDDLAELDSLETERAELETERAEIEQTIEDREGTLAELQAELDAAEADPDALAAEDTDLDALRSARAELEKIEFDLETERETRAELEAERERVASELADLETAEGERAERLAGRLDELRERKRALDATIGDLQSVISFNEDRLAEGGLDLDGGERSGDAVTDRLVEDAITCWTCGSAVERADVSETLERLRALHESKLDERRDLEARIDDLAAREAARRDEAERRERLEQRQESIESELASTAERIESLREAREAQREQVEALEADVEREGTLESVLETQRELTQVELEIERHADRLEGVEERLGELDERLDQRDSLESRRESVDEELQDLRGRVDRIEADAVDSFNEHMDAILAVLEYANIERIWIERRGDPGPDGGRSAFELHVVRTAEDGTTYEDTVEHLSESEREVTGLVFALAGFLAHEVYETVPVMLLDSLEAIDSERIADLVAYFEEYVDCLVVALLPEDAQALPEAYTYHDEF
jgi:hypothetical protein